MALFTRAKAEELPNGAAAAAKIDLSDVEALCRPLGRDPFMRLRPLYSKQAERLSLELAGMAYTLDTEPWTDAGWFDLSVQIDNELQSGLVLGEAAGKERIRAMRGAYRLRRAKSALNATNPISQLMGALRQRERSDTIKAVIMAHRCKGGGYLIAIGFMGTGKRLYDWISNFRFTTEEGFHKGFLQLCEYFEKGEENIVFPQIAAELGLERLTLADVLKELGKSSSRFRLWMAGHSQGGAVMQVFAHRLMHERGAQPQNMVGYGFASPTVVTERTVYDAAAYPLYHIINSDDFVPRMGAVMHLGLCLQYRADEALRQAAYSRSELPASAAAREALFPYLMQMVDTPSILLYSAAFLRCVLAEYGDEAISSLMSRWWSIHPVDSLFQYAGEKANILAERIIEHSKEGYRELTGEPMNGLALNLLTDSFRSIAREIPFRRILAAFAEYIAPPHSLLSTGEHAGAYAYISAQEASALRPFVWLRGADGKAHKAFADEALREANEAEQVTAAVRTRRGAVSAARVGFAGKRRTSLSAQKERAGKRRLH